MLLYILKSAPFKKHLAVMPRHTNVEQFIWSSWLFRSISLHEICTSIYSYFQRKNRQNRLHQRQHVYLCLPEREEEGGTSEGIEFDTCWQC